MSMTRKGFLILNILLISSAFCYSQITIKGEDGTIISESIVDIYIESTIDLYSYQATTINNYDSARTLNAKRIELSFISNTYEIFDWNCGLPPLEAGTMDVFYSPSVFELEFAAGDSMYAGLPTFLFWPYENLGDALYRYVVYDVNNPDDSTWVDVHYHVGFVGIEEKEKEINISLSPNPADQCIEIKINMPNPAIEIYSSRGEKVFSKEYNTTSGEYSIDISSLSLGIYYAHETKSHITRKFIISR